MSALAGVAKSLSVLDVTSTSPSTAPSPVPSDATSSIVEEHAEQADEPAASQFQYTELWLALCCQSIQLLQLGPRLIPAGVLVTVAVKSNEFATPAMATPVTAGAILTLLLALTTAFNALTALTFEVLACCVNVKFAPPVSWPVITPVDVATVAVGPAIGPPVDIHDYQWPGS